MGPRRALRAATPHTHHGHFGFSVHCRARHLLMHHDLQGGALLPDGRDVPGDSGCQPRQGRGNEGAFKCFIEVKNPSEYVGMNRPDGCVLKVCTCLKHAFWNCCHFPCGQEGARSGSKSAPLLVDNPPFASTSDELQPVKLRPCISCERCVADRAREGGGGRDAKAAILSIPKMVYVDDHI